MHFWGDKSFCFLTRGYKKGSGSESVSVSFRERERESKAATANISKKRKEKKESERVGSGDHKSWGRNNGRGSPQVMCIWLFYYLSCFSWFFCYFCFNQNPKWKKRV